MGGGIITDTVWRILEDLADPQTVNAAANPEWRVPLWNTLEENGLTRAWISDAFGGAGFGLAEGFEIINVAGRFALSVPLVETMLAAWLLEQGGITAPDGTMTLAPSRPSDRIEKRPDGALAGTARAVPFAVEANHLAVLVDRKSPEIALVRMADCRLTPAPSMSDDLRATICLDGVVPIAIGAAPAGFDATSLLLMGSIARSVQIAGALQAALSLSVDYANERVAFGKTIGRFQAVQNNLARLAGEVAAATAAADSAADAIAAAGVFDEGVCLEASAAKIRCGEAVGTGTAIAHQVHGAIGLTREHQLHRSTVRAQEWRDDFGSESFWAVWLGSRIAAAGGDQLWPLVASR